MSLQGEHKGPALSERATAALYALRTYRHGEPHESLCDRSRLSHGSWQRAVADLKSAGYLVVSVERHGRTVRACYSLTVEGSRLAATLTQPTSEPTTQPTYELGSVVGREMGSVGCSSSSSSLLKPKAEEKKEERPATEPTQPSHAAHAAQPGDPAALLVPIFDTMRLMLQEHARTQAALAVALERIAYAMPGAPLAPCPSPCDSPREWKTNSKTQERYVTCLRGKACPVKHPKASPQKVAVERAAIEAAKQRSQADIEAERRGIRRPRETG